MKNSKANKIGIEGSSLFNPMGSSGFYTYNLIKYLLIIEKSHKFYIYFNHAPILKKTSLDFKQHNLVQRRYSLLPRAPKSIDVYHDTCQCFPNVKTHAKKIATISNIFPILFPEQANKGDSIFFKRNIEKSVGLNDHFIAPSAAIKKKLISLLKINPSKISVIYTGISEIFKPSSRYQIELALARYSIKQPYILFSGTISEKKNIARIIEAFAQLKYESPPLLVFCGTQLLMKNTVKDLALKFGVDKYVKHIGFVPNRMLPHVLSGSLAFLYPTLHAGFGMNILEAFACGIPVIASQIDEAAEITGGSALLVDPNNPSKMAQGIRAMISNDTLRNTYRQKGFDQALKFSFKKMALETLSLYQNKL